MKPWLNRTLVILSACAFMAPTLASADGIPFHKHKISGCIVSAVPYNLQLRDGRHVQLHNGTVITPTGTTLSPHMRVSIRGHRGDDPYTFLADSIKVSRHECHL